MPGWEGNLTGSRVGGGGAELVGGRRMTSGWLLLLKWPFPGSVHGVWGVWIRERLLSRLPDDDQP